ncbi:MAG: hypothetical protein JXR49_12330 [Acidobacteria bacterium]|nr:hypothetical protein [Acidobacteriota bacterium]
MDPDNIVKRDFQEALQKAEKKRSEKKLPEIGRAAVMNLRHTFRSLKIDQGENIYYVMRQMGHSSIQVAIDVYGHLLKDWKPEAAAKTDEVIFGSFLQ